MNVQRISATKQGRLDLLLDKNREGTLTDAERSELRELAREAEDLTLKNAQLLAQEERSTTPG